MQRKTFATTIDVELQDKFKVVCKDKGLKINETLEAIMQAFVDGKIQVEVKTTYSVSADNSK